jgi:hypothetical protein
MMTIIWISKISDSRSRSPEPVVSLKVERDSRILYRSKDNRQEKIFDALDWLASITSHIPNPDEQLEKKGMLKG